MKKYVFLAVSALALASCSSDDFVGTEGGNVENGANKAINFGGETGKITRANSEGEAAATLLGNNFVVVGFKGNETAAANTNLVFDTTMLTMLLAQLTQQHPTQKAGSM